MKKITILLAAVTLSSCSFEKYVDCDCNTVYEVIENPSDDGSISGIYRTYNACQDKFSKKTWIETAPKIGECK